MGLGAALKASSGNLDAAFVGGGDLSVWFTSSDIGHDVDFVRRGESITGQEIATHLRRKAVTRSQPSIRKDVLEVIER